MSRLSRRPMVSIRSPNMLSVLNLRMLSTEELDRERPSRSNVANSLERGLDLGLVAVEGGLLQLSREVVSSETTDSLGFSRSFCWALS